MKLLTADQIRAWDSFTIQNEPISSLGLMERASSVFTDWFSMIYDNQKPVLIFCGTGNNGGDGLAIARFLHYLLYDVRVYICSISKTMQVSTIQINCMVVLAARSSLKMLKIPL